MVYGPCLSYTVKFDLRGSVSPKQLRRPSSEAPWGDGFNAFFLSLDMFCDDVIAVVLNFSSGKLLKKINSTTTSFQRFLLIPSLTLGYSLLQFCYKRISKILSRRLAGVMNFVVGSNQAAFVKERLIFDILLTPKIS